jgi:hypothetical protein
MILFSEDWSRYPSAIADVTTRNHSFLRQAAVYREMGIKNHAFLLALHNPLLQGVDPHDPNLTEDQITMILAECKVNPWYFFREVMRVPGGVGEDDSIVQANRGNIALWFSFFNHAFITLIQPRQTGKSFSTDALMVELLNLQCEDLEVNLVTKDDTLRRKNVERIKKIMDALPPYMHFRGRDDSNNGEEITIRKFRNTYTTHVARSEEKSAHNMGRGLTTAVVHFDEPAFQKHIGTAMKAMLAATGAARDKARRAGLPYGTILTTTAGKKDDRDGKFIYNILQNSAVWNDHWFDAKNTADFEHLVRAAAPGGKFRINATFSYKQLGKTDAWMKQALEDSLQEGLDADRDYFNVWTSGNESHPLSIELLAKIVASKREAFHNELVYPQGYSLRWNIPENEIEQRMATGHYILGQDPSEASGKDDISLVLVDVSTAETIMVAQVNETLLYVFCNWFCEFMAKYENVTAIIERRSMGQAVLDTLLEKLPAMGIDPYKRLFNMVVNNRRENPERFEEITVPMARRDPSCYVRHKALFGFATSGQGQTSRTGLYNETLQAAARASADRIFDIQLAEQITSLIVKNNRIDHDSGKHDDLVIGWLLCHWFLTKAQNTVYYGLDPLQVLRGTQRQRAMTPEEEYVYQQQQEYRRQIDDITQRLKYERDEFISMRLEQQLRDLDARLVLDEGEEIYSIDQLITSVREQKRARQRGVGSTTTMSEQFNRFANGIGGNFPTQGNYNFREPSFRNPFKRAA